MEKKHKLLIVDDDQIAQKTLTKSLERAGFECASAFDVEDGLKQLRELLPDLVILDIVFDYSSGTVFLRDMKKWLQSDAKQPPVLVLSGCNDNGIRYYAMELGAAKYVLKPYEMKDLINMINELIGQSNNS